MTGTQGNWSDERVELVRARWLEGLSATQIAVELNALYPLRFGFISRNAVIGKIHRLGLSGPNSQGGNVRARHSTFARSVKRENNPTFTPRIVVEEKPPEVIGPENDFPPHGCCLWTNDHPAIQTYRFCGQPVFVRTVKGEKVASSFCEYHDKRAHQPPKGFEAVPLIEADRLEPDERVPKPLRFGLKSPPDVLFLKPKKRTA